MGAGNTRNCFGVLVKDTASRRHEQIQHASGETCTQGASNDQPQERPVELGHRRLVPQSIGQNARYKSSQATITESIPVAHLTRNLSSDLFLSSSFISFFFLY